MLRARRRGSGSGRFGGLGRSAKIRADGQGRWSREFGREGKVSAGKDEHPDKYGPVYKAMPSGRTSNGMAPRLQKLNLVLDMAVQHAARGTPRPGSSDPMAVALLSRLAVICCLPGGVQAPGCQPSRTAMQCSMFLLSSTTTDTLVLGAENITGSPTPIRAPLEMLALVTPTQ
ncbi:unnamed protein product [Diplocarpon coronariae]